MNTNAGAQTIAGTAEAGRSHCMLLASSELSLPEPLVIADHQTIGDF